MIQELDTVVIAHNIDQYGLQKNDIGAVVHRYKNGEAFEVEFVTGEGAIITVLTLTKAEVRPIRHQEIFHVRELIAA